ncbi:Methyl-accepting chemotaxis protein [Desulfonatronum zhilinae]|nr:Methyl-accepting chemotaxis protein [Desulfonatronum zhilinae]
MQRILGDLRISVKLMLLIIVPIAAMLIISGVVLKERRQTMADMQRLEQLILLSVRIGNLIHDMQVERGLSAGFVSSQGREFGAELNAQLRRTDQSLAAFQDFVDTGLAGLENVRSQAQAQSRELGRLREFRAEVSARDITGIQTVDKYTGLIESLMASIRAMPNATDDSDATRFAVAYAALLQAKEYAGQERAILSNIFTAQRMTGEQLRRWLNVLVRQDELFDVFLAYAPPTQRTALTNVMNEHGPRVAPWRDRVFSSMEGGTLAGDAGQWFRDSTSRIEGLKRIEDTSARDMEAMAEDLARQARSAFALVSALIAAALVVTGLLAAAIMRGISGPVSRTVSFARAVAQGDLSQKLTIRQGDEIGVLCDALRTMVDALKEKIAEAEAKTAEAAQEAERARQATSEAEAARAQAERAKKEGMIQAAAKIEHVVERLSSASQELSAQVEHSSQGAKTQKERITETATAMEEMNATVLEVARNASNAAQSADSARQDALAGADAVRKVVGAIGRVQNQATELKTNMGELAKAADGIGRIIGVINDIADQTNLLALNAAIEAARAGDAGRGFAVVADEVRKLAEKTMVATKEVEQAIHGIQSVTQVNAQSVDQSVTIIQDATGLANDSGKTLERIVELVADTSDQVSSIAAASEEQSAASEEINRAISEVNQVADETAAGMDESASAVNELAEQAQELQRLVEVMAKG